MWMLVALLVSSQLFAQPFSLGVRAGIPITRMFTAEGPQQAAGPRWMMGALVEVHLWRGAGFGADFLVQRADLSVSPAGSRRARVWRWETPITLIYRIRTPTGPFVRTGVSINRVFAISGVTECARGPFGEQFYCLEGRPLVELRHRGTSGFIVGTGLRFKFKKFWFEPEVRLTRWIDRNFGVQDSAVRSNLDQIAILAGVRL
jgi:hypothetical protein